MVTTIKISFSASICSNQYLLFSPVGFEMILLLAMWFFPAGVAPFFRLQDKRWEASVLHNTAQIYVRRTFSLEKTRASVLVVTSLVGDGS